MRVLSSNPSSEYNQLWLPYQWGRFREYCDHRSEHDLSFVEWLDPVYLGYPEYEKCIEGIDFTRVDVLLLSVYVWNEDRQLEIATHARQKNPGMVILAGGPSALYRPHQNTSIYEVCDYVVPYEGEAPIAEVLHRLHIGHPINDIEALVDPRFPRDVVETKRVELSEAQSPYVLYYDDYKRFSDDIKGMEGTGPFVVWETNRGCPYKCSFCDWGSLTQAKIKRYSKESMLEECDAFSSFRVTSMLVADANFGMWEDEYNYLERLAENKKKTGFPIEVYFSPAKNNKSIPNRMIKLLFDNNMISSACINLQHTDQEVLNAIDRFNINKEAQIDELVFAYENNIPSAANLIIGLPGDTLEKWKECIVYCLELGLHEDLKIFEFSLLPNSPAADPSYRNLWQIETMKRQSFTGVFKSLHDSSIVCSTATYTREDLVDMHSWDTFIMAFHNLNISRFVSMYLYHYEDVGYREFYERLMKMPFIKTLYDDIHDHFHEYVFGGETAKKYANLNGRYIDYEVRIKNLALHDMKRVMGDIETLTRELSSLDDNKIRDLMKAQYLTHVSWKDTPELTLEYNWPEIFKNMLGGRPLEKINSIQLIPKRNKVKLSKKVVGVHWLHDISHIKTEDAWVADKVLRRANQRTAMNHYQEILEM